MPSVTGLSHVAIGVSNMDESLKFYRDALGMTLTVDRVETRSGERPKNRRACYLRWEQRPGASYIVLDQQLDQIPANSAAPLFALGFHHIAFRTDDVAGIVERARQHGADVLFVGSVHDGYANAEPSPGHEVVTAMVFDPDRNIVQFDQWLTA
jgi:catechol 2,3-dioxygenase-like lactoylglutathione lyase family enzyme